MLPGTQPLLDMVIFVFGSIDNQNKTITINGIAGSPLTTIISTWQEVGAFQ